MLYKVGDKVKVTENIFKLVETGNFEEDCEKILGVEYNIIHIDFNNIDFPYIIDSSDGEIPDFRIGDRHIERKVL